MNIIDQRVPDVNYESEVQPVRYVIDSTLPELSAYADPERSNQNFNTRINRSVENVPAISG